MIVIFVTSPALVLPEPAPSKLSHMSKIASTHPVEETIYSVMRERERERKRERGMGSAVIAVLVCVLLDFMNPAQALGGWLGRRGASYRSCVYSGPDHLNIVSKSRG